MTRKMTAAEIAWRLRMGDRERDRRAVAGIDPADCPACWSTATRRSPGGRTVAKAVETAVAIECVAHMALMSLALAPDLEPIETELLRQALQAQARPRRLLRPGQEELISAPSDGRRTIRRFT